MKSSDGSGTDNAFAYALRVLSRRDHSEAELRRKLCVRGIPEGIAEEVIGRLKELRYLDDRRFAERWSASAVQGGRGFGTRLRVELSRRGVPATIIAEVLAVTAVEFDEGETLRGIVARKFSGFDPRSASEREKRRVMGYLLRRGFSRAAIFEFFRENPE